MAVKIFKRKELIEIGICPNCWGEQSYEDQVRVQITNKQIDINEPESRNAFIKEFVAEHVSDIHLVRRANGLQCPNCMRIVQK